MALMLQVCFLLMALVLLGAKGKCQPLTTIEYKQSIKNTLRTGEEHRYQLHLRAGEYACIEIEHPADLNWRVLNAQGQEYYGHDLDPKFPNQLHYIAVTDTIYQIRFTAPVKFSPAQPYRLYWKEKRSATNRDRVLVDARQLDEEAVLAYNERQIKAYARTIEKCRMAIDLYEAIGASFDSARLHNLTGLSWHLLGERALAEQSYQQALVLFRNLQRRDKESNVLDNLSRLSLAWHDYSGALYYASQALTIARQEHDFARFMSCFNGLADIYRSSGEFTKAIDLNQEAIAIARAHPNINYSPMNELVGLLGISHSYFALGEGAKGTFFLRQGKALYDRGVSVSPIRIVSVQAAQAAEYLRKGAPKDALTLLQSIPALEKLPPYGRAVVLLRLGQTYAALARFDEAQAAFGQAQQIAQHSDFQNIALEILLEKMHLAKARQDWDEAINLGTQAITLMERQSHDIYDYDVRTSLLATQRHIYELQTNLLMQRSVQLPARRTEFEAAALHVSERGRARSWLNVLQPATLSAQAVTAQQELRAKLEATASALSKTPITNHTQKQDLTRQLTLLTTELKLHYAAPQKNEPALPPAQALSLPEIQQQVLDKNTLLLEYSLGTEHSYLFVVSATSLQTFVLPARAVLEQQAKALYHLMERRANPPVFATLDAAIQWKAELQKQYAQVAARLSGMLFAPVRDLLLQQRLLIIPDGALHYVPFAALPEFPAPGLAGQPLIVKHEILTLPSASTLAIQRRRWMSHTIAPKILAVLADPVFSRTDPRFNSHPAIPKTPSESPLMRLAASRSEATALQGLVAPSEQFVALDYAANLTTAKSELLQQYRYVHFATHGLFDNEHPELSSLVFSRWDEQGNAQAGNLRVLDVFQLRLNAELVVLSGCHTGAGKEINGEGLNGLSRSFMNAGAKRVLASLWQVHDTATAQFMTYFYERLLRTPALSPAAALREAQLALYQSKQWNDPFYWATFTLQGEW